MCLKLVKIFKMSLNPYLNDLFSNIRQCIASRGNFDTADIIVLCVISTLYKCCFSLQDFNHT